MSQLYLIIIIFILPLIYLQKFLDQNAFLGNFNSISQQTYIIRVSVFVDLLHAQLDSLVIQFRLTFLLLPSLHKSSLDGIKLKNPYISFSLFCIIWIHVIYYNYFVTHLNITPKHQQYISKLYDRIKKYNIIDFINATSVIYSMTDIGSLYTLAFNSSGPVFILIILGVIFYFANITPKQSFREINAIAFKFALPVNLISTIGQVNFNRQNLLVIATIAITTIIGIIITLPFCFLYKRGEKLKAFANLISISTMNTAVLSGVPIVNGIFNYGESNQQAFIQLLVIFIIVIPTMYFSFEFDINGIKGLKNTILKTIKQPVPISLLLGLIYNGIGTRVSFIRNPPPYLSIFFGYCRSIFVSIGLLCLGMFASDQVKTKHEKMTTNLSVQLISFVAVNLQRCLLLPIIFAAINYQLKIPKIVNLVSTVLYMTPTAVLGYAICDEYRFGAIWPGIQSVIGIVLSSLMIPIIQIFIDFVYNGEDFPLQS